MTKSTKNQAKSTKILDIVIRMGYDDGTTTSSSGYPHPSFCGFFVPCACQASISQSSYDGSREPNTTPLPKGNKLRRLDAVVEARRPMPTKQSATYPTNHLGKVMHTLSFNGVTLTPVHHNSQIYLTSAELAKALGYARSDYISTIYNRNIDEFSSDMTLTVKLSVKGFGNGNSEKETRIFSLRGCHLIAMFARTPVAKDFRKWVLDILDREVGAPVMTETKPITPTLSTADYAIVQRAVQHIASGMRFSNTSVNAIYARLRTLCGVDSVTDLSYEHLPLIQNELYRIERTLAPYKKMRIQAEKQLIRRVCGGDELAVSQAILDIEKTAHDYATENDRRLSATIQIEQIGLIGGTP